MATDKGKTCLYTAKQPVIFLILYTVKVKRMMKYIFVLLIICVGDASDECIVRGDELYCGNEVNTIPPPGMTPALTVTRIYVGNNCNCKFDVAKIHKLCPLVKQIVYLDEAGCQCGVAPGYDFKNCGKEYVYLALKNMYLIKQQ